ncbi:MAG TPA: hypothetical protein VF156_05720 [Agromyces sp.]
MDLLMIGALLVLVFGTISVTGYLRDLRDAADRTAAATESLLELERVRRSADS